MIQSVSRVLILSLAISTNLLAFISVNDSSEIGTLQVTRYADDRNSAFSFSFDDGYLSHYVNARPILNNFGFRGTFNVMPPFLTDNFPAIWRYGIWPQFQTISAEGHEVASHTMNHLYLTSLPVGDTSTEGTMMYELYQSKVRIEQKITNKKCISLAYPFSDKNELVDSVTALFYENGRTAGLEPNDDTLGTMDWYDLNSYVVQFDMPRETIADDLDELYAFVDWTHSSILNGKWAIMMLHEVVPQSELVDLVSQGLYEPISDEWLTYFCEWLNLRSNDNEVWVATVGNITRYLKERDNYEYEITTASQNLVEINLYDDLDDEIYNYPLSAYVVVPSNWNFALSEQNGIKDTLSVIQTDSGKVVLAKIIPDAGTFKLSPFIPTSVSENLPIVNDFLLYQNYPNPFNPSTRISFQIPERSFVTLKVYDLLGNEINTLLNEEKEAGTFEINFNANDLASGMYFYTLKAANFLQTKKMILLR